MIQETKMNQQLKGESSDLQYELQGEAVELRCGPPIKVVKLNFCINSKHNFIRVKIA